MQFRKKHGFGAYFYFYFQVIRGRHKLSKEKDLTIPWQLIQIRNGPGIAGRGYQVVIKSDNVPLSLAEEITQYVKYMKAPKELYINISVFFPENVTVVNRNYDEVFFWQDKELQEDYQI